MDYWVDVAEIDSLLPGTCRTVEVAGVAFALARVGEVFHAVDNACPHRGGPLGGGTIEEGKVYCPLHGWAFDLATGGCVDRPEKSIRSYPVALRDGNVWVNVAKV